jgi:hypothetical protein
MLHKIARYLNIFVVILMTIDLVGASFAASPFHNEGKTSYHARHSNTSGFAFVFFEKQAEEETEKNEEARENFIGAELVDFSQVANLLSKVSPGIISTNPEQQFLIGPPLFTLHCVFLI